MALIPIASQFHLKVMSLNGNDRSLDQSPEVDALRTWANRQSEVFVIKEGALNFTGRGNIGLRAPIPDVPLKLEPKGGEIIVQLNGHRIPTLVPSVGRTQVYGPGSVDKVSFASDRGGTSFWLDRDVHIGRIDSIGSTHTTLEPASGPLVIEEMRLDSHPISVHRSKLIVSQLHAVEGVVQLNGEMVVERVKDGKPLKIVSGKLVVNTLPRSAVVEVVGPAALQLVGHHNGCRVNLEGGTLAIADRESVIERFSIGGSRGTVSVAYGRVVRPVFDTPLELEVGDDGEVTGIHGAVQLVLADSGTVSGDPTTGLLVDYLRVVESANGPSQPRAVEAISFLDLDPAYLSVLQRVGRVSGSWPHRRVALKRAREIDCGVRSLEELPNARAHYWLSVEHLLKDKHSSGRDLAIAHEIAEDARRRAVIRGTPSQLTDAIRSRQMTQLMRVTKGASSTPLVERGLLELSRLSGYGSRIGRPLLAWLISAAVFSVLIRASAGGLCFSGCSVDSGLALYWDLLVAPVTFIRPTDDGSVVRALVADDLPGRILAFFSRAVGTWMLLSLALAVRRYLRTP